MKASVEKLRESTAERLSRWGRNFNALGALALGGLAMVVPVGSGILAAGAGINAVQAGGFEWARQRAKKSRIRKTSNK